MTLIIGGIARKGGVGKTTTIMNLGAACARAGLFTVIIEADGQGNASRRVGLDPRDDFYDLVLGDAAWEDVMRPVPQDFTGAPDADLMLVSAWNATREVEEDKRTPGLMFDKLNTLRGYADVVLIDTSPGITQVHSGVYYAADLVFIPTMTELDSVDGTMDTLDFLDRARKEAEGTDYCVAEVLGALPMRVEKNTRTAKNNLEMLRLLMRRRHVRVFDPIPSGVAWQESRNRNLSIYTHREHLTSDYDRASAVEAVRRFDPFVAEVLKRVNAAQEVIA